MTVHFAAARSRSGSPLGRILGQGRTPVPANDTAPRHADPLDELTVATLRHFADHGLGAAKAARAQAEEAHRAGLIAESEYWRDICGKLDRREARHLERRREDRLG